MNSLLSLNAHQLSIFAWQDLVFTGYSVWPRNSSRALNTVKELIVYKFWRNLPSAQQAPVLQAVASSLAQATCDSRFACSNTAVLM